LTEHLVFEISLDINVYRIIEMITLHNCFFTQVMFKLFIQTTGRVWIQPLRPGTSRTVSGFIAKDTVQCCRVEKGLDRFSEVSANVFNINIVGNMDCDGLPEMNSIWSPVVSCGSLRGRRVTLQQCAIFAAEAVATCGSAAAVCGSSGTFTVLHI
jgi:hypothetical protein